jgi:NitT/TauT family transport system substrate-binding protein
VLLLRSSDKGGAIVTSKNRRVNRVGQSLLAIAAGLLISSVSTIAAEIVHIGLPIAVEISFAPVYAAQELGYDEKNGIKFEITTYRGAGAAQEVLAAGGADIINVGPTGVAAAVSKGIKELIIGCGPQVRPDGWNLLVLANSSIKSVKDLDGKKVAVSSKNGASDFYAIWAARQANVNYEIVPLGGGNDWPALRRGQVDATVRSSTQALQLMLAGAARSILDFQAAMEPNYPECWVATTAMLRDKPAAVHGFLKAVDDATKKMIEDEAFAIKVLRTMMGNKDDAYSKYVYDRVIKKLTTKQSVDLAILRYSLNLAEVAGIKGLPPAEKLVADFAIEPKLNR